MSSACVSPIFQTLGVLFLIGLALLFAYVKWLPPQSAWLIVVSLLLVLCVALGVWFMKLPLGILVSERNLMRISHHMGDGVLEQ